MKTREPRHKVLVRARMKVGAGWHDACILNISSRGMLMQAGVPPVRGSYLEIRRGPVVVVARVMWNKSHRFGVKSQDLLPIDAIVGSGLAATVGDHNSGAVDRREIQRPSLSTNDRSRLRGRLMEYGFVAALAVGVAVFAAGQAYTILERPVAAVDAALTGADVKR